MSWKVRSDSYVGQLAVRVEVGGESLEFRWEVSSLELRCVVRTSEPRPPRE